MALIDASCMCVCDQTVDQEQSAFLSAHAGRDSLFTAGDRSVEDVRSPRNSFPVSICSLDCTACASNLLGSLRNLDTAPPLRLQSNTAICWRAVGAFQRDHLDAGGRGAGHDGLHRLAAR
jgi:hypothetical protein